MSDFEPEYVEYHVDWCGNTHTNEEMEKRNENLLFILKAFIFVCWLAVSFTYALVASITLKTPVIVLFWVLFIMMAAMPLIYLYFNIPSGMRENAF